MFFEVAALFYIFTNSVKGCSMMHKHLLPLFLVAVLTGVKWNFKVIEICISFIAKDILKIMKRLIVTYISSLEHSLFSSIPDF